MYCVCSLMLNGMFIRMPLLVIKYNDYASCTDDFSQVALVTIVEYYNIFSCLLFFFFVIVVLASVCLLIVISFFTLNEEDKQIQLIVSFYQVHQYSVNERIVRCSPAYFTCVCVCVYGWCVIEDSHFRTFAKNLKICHETESSDYLQWQDRNDVEKVCSVYAIA